MNFLHPLRGRICLAAMIAAVALSTTSCGWLSGLEIDETKDWTPNKLYTEAREAMNSSDWTLAKNYYTKLEARYPFGAYAQQAQLELAYVYFKDEEAAAAVETLDRFLQAYPNHPNSDYALYLKALATLNEKEGLFSSLTRQDLSDRDAKAARDAFDIYKELAARFPESRYASEARRRMHELVNAQARHQVNTARFYYDRHAYVAAINRAKIVLTDFQQTSASDDAMKIIADSYHELGMLDLEKDMRRVIELNKDRKLSKGNRY
jgi:outer membrane protein assembly factor BamD